MLARVALGQGHTVTAADIGSPKDPVCSQRWESVDIRTEREVDILIGRVNPEFVVNAAAVADIDRAEREREVTEEVNVAGARFVAEACGRRGLRHLFISSDAVFSGRTPPYREEDPVDPVNFYGQTKARAERLVAAVCPTAVIVRLSLVLGSPCVNGNSFLVALIAKLAQGQSVACSTEEIRTPIDVLTLSECILELGANRICGVLHLGATGSVSRYDIARTIALRLGYNPKLVTEQKGTGVGRVPRHTGGVLSVARAASLLKTPLLTVDQTIERALQRRMADAPTPRLTPATVGARIVHELEVAFGTVYGCEEEQAVVECIRAKAPSCGKRVKLFEEAFAAYCGTRYAVAVTSATSGLTLAGVAVGVKAGDEVITTPISWIATASAFSNLGARIVFCDVDRRTLNLDPAKLETCITPRTRAIVPVHLYGQCCAMDEITAIASRYHIAVIEDCAHNPGGDYLGCKSGSWGDLGVFSFHQQKNMSTLGEGGMVTTNSRQLYERMLSYRSLCCRIYGGSDKYLAIDEAKSPMNREYWRLQFDDIGYNYRMTDVQAAAGIVQLEKLDGLNKRRIELAARLTARLHGIRGLTLPFVDPRGTHVFHLYVVQLEKDFPLSKRDFMWKLYTEWGIKAWSHYIPIHLTAPYRTQGHAPGECPEAEAAYARYVSLPIHPRLTDEAIDYMALAVKTLAEEATPV